MVWGRPAGITDLIEKVEKNETKTMCVMPFRKCADGDAIKLAQALKGNSSLVELLFSGHKLDVAASRALGEALASHPTLKHFAIGDAQYGDEAASAFLSAAAPNKVLERLDLENKGLTAASLPALAAFLAASNLRSLHLSQNNFHDDGVFASLKASGLGHLIHLELAGCRLGDSGALQLADVLASSPAAANFRLLDIAENGLSAASAAAIGAALRHCTNLRELRLSGNHFGDEGMRAIVEGLAQRPSQATPLLLMLEDCAVGGGFGAILAAGLKSGLTLSRLVLTRNAGLTPASLADLLAAADDRIHVLDLSQCSAALNPEVLTQFASVQGLAKLCLFGCGLGPTGLDVLLSSLATSGGFPDLVELDICANGLELEPLKKMVHALKDPALGPKLHTVVIGANPGAQRAEDLEQSLHELFEVRPDLDIAHRASGDQSGQGGDSEDGPYA